MPADITRAKNFRLTTDYPLDKVVFQSQGSFNVPASGTVNLPIPHGLGFKPLPLGVWSMTPDFSVSYDFGSGPLGGNPFAVNNSLVSNTPNITVSATNNTGSAITFYYRVYCFEPSDVNLQAPSTNVISDTFQFNSGFNYSKLFINTVVPLAPNATANVVHGLGYRPQALIWQELTATGDISPVTVANIGIGPFLMNVTTSVLSLQSLFGPAARIHVRIYLDD